jgi:type VI secretion system secreted protein VgrG
MIKSVGPVTMSGPGWVAAAAFRSMHVSEQLGEPFFYELEVLSEEASLKPADVLGQAVTISLQVGATLRHFNGFATSLVRLGTLKDYYHYRIALRPWVWFLSRATNCRIFQALSIPDIIKSVFREHGFTDFDEALSGNYAAVEFLVQYRESDLNFVRRLMEQEGIYFFFKHDQATHTLIMADSVAAHTPTPFHKALPFAPPDENRDAHFDHVRSWEIVNEVETGAYALTDYDFKKPRAPLAVLKAFASEYAHAEYETFDFPGNYTETDAGNRYALTRLEELHATRNRTNGEANARGLLVGALFTLSEHPVAAANRDYLVVSCEAHIRSHELESGTADPGEVFWCRFTTIESDHQFRPQRVTSKPLVRGAQTATVVGAKDTEICTNEYGSVRLRFHWDRFSKGDETSSCWVRVAQAWAGTDFGSMFIPRIGQEVIVEFLEGDPDRPIVTGRVYNNDNKPPYTLDLNQTQSGIKSRSTPKGNQANCNEIRFEDKKGSELFFMQAEKDHTTEVKNNQSTNVIVNRSASVGGSDSVSVGGNRSVAVTGTLTVTVDGGQSTLTVKGKHNVDATDTVEVQAPTHIKLTVGSSSILIEPTTITLQAGGGAKLVLDANAFALSNGGSALLLDANALMTSNGGSAMLLDANVLTQSSGGSQVLLDGDAKLATGGNVTVSGTKVSLAGSDSGKLDLEAAGATLAGPKISSASAGVHEITGSVVKIN